MTAHEATAHGRPKELEDWLNGKIYHPLSMRLAKILAPTPISPNMVSIAGGLMIVLAAVVYGQGSNWTVVLIGLAVHMGWHVLDGADGDLARLTGRTSPLGETIDGICDIAGHVVLYVVLGGLLADELQSSTGWWLAAAAGFCRIIQAAHYEVQRRQYQHWVYGTAWLRVSDPKGDQPTGFFGLAANFYILVGKLFAPGGREVDALAEEFDAKHLNQLRAIIRKETIPVLRSTYLLSANYRTIVLGGSMLAGSPLFFFLFESLALSFILIGSILTASRATRRIRRQAKSLR